jgi:hypothetical protein
MRLPTQCQPVERSLPSQPCANRGGGGAAVGERGIQPSKLGLPPIDWLIQPRPPVFTTLPVHPKTVFYD